LSALSFLQAFRQFTFRRGLPAKLQSDNAKTFKASSVNIRKIIQAAEVKTDLANKQVVWEFIVEKAPWWGGYWERLVRSVKLCLKKSVGQSSLNFEELRMLMVEIECTLNNRPRRRSILSSYAGGPGVWTAYSNNTAINSIRMCPVHTKPRHGE
jgi:hypothetical protein